MGNKFDYLKVKKALQETHQLPGHTTSDRSWEVEVKKKEVDDKLNPPAKSPEEIVKLKDDDYDYYTVKKGIGLR